MNTYYHPSLELSNQEKGCFLKEQRAGMNQANEEVSKMN
jgi:hypothetical protein